MSGDFSVTVDGQQRSWSEGQVRQKLENLGSLSVDGNLVRVSSDLSTSRSSGIMDKVWRVMVFCIPKLAEISHRRLERASATLEEIGRQIEAESELQQIFDKAQQAFRQIALKNLSVDGKFKNVVSEFDEEKLTSFQTISDIFRFKALKVKNGDRTSCGMLEVVQLVPQERRDRGLINNIITLFRNYSVSSVFCRCLSFKNKEEGSPSVADGYRDFKYLMRKVFKEDNSLTFAFNILDFLPEEKRSFDALKSLLDIEGLCEKSDDADDDETQDFQAMLRAVGFIFQKIGSDKGVWNIIEGVKAAFGILEMMGEHDSKPSVDSLEDGEETLLGRAFQAIPKDKRDIESLKVMIEIFCVISQVNDDDDFFDSLLTTFEKEPQEERSLVRFKQIVVDHVDGTSGECSIGTDEIVRRALRAIPKEKRNFVALEKMIEIYAAVQADEADAYFESFVTRFESKPEEERTIEVFLSENQYYNTGVPPAEAGAAGPRRMGSRLLPASRSGSGSRAQLSRLLLTSSRSRDE